MRHLYVKSICFQVDEANLPTAPQAPVVAKDSVHDLKFTPSMLNFSTEQ